MGKLALVVRSGAPGALVLATNLELQPKRVLAIEHHVVVVVVVWFLLILLKFAQTLAAPIPTCFHVASRIATMLQFSD